MIRELMAFEWRYHTRQPSFFAAAALFFLLGFTLTGSSFGPENVAVTAPWLVMETLAFVSLFSVFAIAIFVANAVIRDTEHRFAEIVFTTPVGRFPYLFGRFGGAFAAAATTLLLAPIGMMIASRMPWIEPARAGTLSIATYAWAFLVMVLPTLLFATALLFAFAVLTRSPLATYTASIFIYILYMVCAALTNSPLMAASSPGAGTGGLASLLDPFGLTSFFEVTRYWSVAEKNARLVPLSGTLLLNRLVWIAVASGTLAFAYRAFRFRLLAKSSLEKRAGAEKEASPRPVSPPVILRRADAEGSQPRRPSHSEILRSAQDDGRRRPSHSEILRSAQDDGRHGPSHSEILRSAQDDGRGQPSHSATVPSAQDDGRRQPSHSETVPSAHDDRSGQDAGAYRRQEQTPSTLASYWSATKLEFGAVARSLPARLVLLLWFVLAFMEIRTEVFEGEYGAAFYPATTLIVGTLKAPLFIIGMVIVIYYGSELFWREQRFRFASIVDATPVRGAAMVLAKWSALVLLIAAAIATSILAGLTVQLTSGYTDIQPLLYLSLFYFDGLPLALYAAAAVAIHALSPGKYAGLVFVLLFFVFTRASGMLGIEHPLLRFANGPTVSWSALFGFADSASAFGVLMLHWSIFAAAFLLLAGATWRQMREAAFARWRVVARATRVWAPVLLVALLTGGWIAYDHRDFESSDMRMNWRADYERRYRPLSNEAQPRISAIRTSVHIHPETRRVQLGGAYTLVNDTPSAIRTVHVTTRRDAKRTHLRIPSAQLTTDARFAMHHFALARPLAPGEKTTLHFELDFDDMAEENGTLIMSFLTYPSIGYRATYELADPRERARRKLGHMSAPELEDPEAAATGAESPIELVATLSTAHDQTAITSGRLVRTWRDGDRRFFEYQSDAPIVNRFAIASARYEVARRNADDVEVSVAYHPPHRANVERILDAAARTLAYCDREFAPYPHKQLKLVEVPPEARFGAFATPDTLLLNENRTMLIDARDERRLDLLSRRVAHEVAHEWWGYQLVPESRSGSTTLVETLAKYSELMILERMHGRDEVRQLLEYELDRYLAGRSGDDHAERTLMTARSQPYIYYSKGAIVTYAIRDLIGEAALNTALRRLIAEKRGTATATTLDLRRHLRAVSNDTQFALIDRWLSEIVLYDLRVESATATPLADGRYRVHARIHASAVVAQADGNERAIPFDEMLDVAIDDIAIAKQRLRNGANDVTFIVAKKPTTIAIDPNILRIDRNRHDNHKRVTITAPAR